MDLPKDRTTAAQPTCFYILNDNTIDGPQIGLYPIPDKVYTLNLHFKLDPARAIANDDNVMIDDRYISGVLDLAISNMITNRLVKRELKEAYRDVMMTAKGDADGSRASTANTALWDVDDSTPYNDYGF